MCVDSAVYPGVVIRTRVSTTTFSFKVSRRVEMSFRKFSLLAHLSRIEPPQQETRKEWTKDKNFLEKTVGTEKSSRFNIAWRKRTRRTKPLSLSFDIAMEVAKFIDIPDIFSLSKVSDTSAVEQRRTLNEGIVQVSRLFNSVVNSRALWDGFMKEYSAKCLPLVADELSTPSELSVHDLKKAVIRTRYLVINWESKHPTHISPTSTVSLERTLVKNIQSRGPYLVSHNCMIVSIGSGSWACFRLDTGVCVSTCKPPRSLSAHPFIFPHSKSSSVYTVTTEHFGTRFVCSPCLLCGTHNISITAQSFPLGGYNYHQRPTILAMHSPNRFKK